MLHSVLPDQLERSAECVFLDALRFQIYWIKVTSGILSTMQSYKRQLRLYIKVNETSFATQLSIYGKLLTLLPWKLDAKNYRHYFCNRTML